MIFFSWLSLKAEKVTSSLVLNPILVGRSVPFVNSIKRPAKSKPQYFGCLRVPIKNAYEETFFSLNLSDALESAS